MKTLANSSVQILIIAWFCLHLQGLWASNADVAHHYALAYRVSETLNFIGTMNDSSLGEANIYPRGSHSAAALLGRVMGSVILGISITVLLSLAVLWLSIFYLLSTLPMRIGLLAAFLAMTAVVISVKMKIGDVLGAEVIENFGFAQLVGQAIVLLGLAMAARIERKYSVAEALGSLIFTLVIALAVHLKPSLEILGVLIFALVIVSLQPGHTGFVRQIKLRNRIILTVLVCTSVIIAVLLHPSFSAMKTISKHNGDLVLNTFVYPNGVFGLVLLGLFSSLLVLRQWLARMEDATFIALKYLSLFGLSASLCCIAQFVALSFGHGSPYAVEKYVFALFTVIIINASLLVAFRLSAFLQGSKYYKPMPGFPGKQVCLMCGTIVLFILPPHAAKLSIATVENLERRVVLLTSLLNLRDASSKPIGAIDLPNVDAVVDYMISIAVLRTPRELATPQILLADEILTPDKFSHIITSRNGRYVSSYNEQPPNLDLVTVSPGEDIALHRSYSFRSLDLQFVSWSDPETEFRWSCGKYCEIAFNVGKLSTKPRLLLLRGASLGPQRTEVSLNGVTVFTGQLSGTAESIEIPLQSSLVKVGQNILGFALPDARIPGNGDDRVLGIALKSIEFQ